MKDFKNMKDTDFDRLFSEAADQSVPDFEESSWDKMAVLLDDSEGPKGFGWKKPLIYSGIILLLLSISYFAFKGFSNNGLSNNEVRTPISSSLEASPTEEANKLELNEDLAKTEESDIATIKRKEDVTNVLEKANDEGSLKRESTISKESVLRNRPKSKNLVEHPIVEIDNGKIGTLKTETIDALKPSLSKANVINENVFEDSFDNEESISGGEATSTNMGNSILSEESPDPLVNKELDDRNKISNQLGFKNTTSMLTEIDSKPFKRFSSFIAPFTIIAPEKVFKEVIEEESLEKGFGLRLAFSPDFSVVPENSFFKIGHNWVALLEYRLNNRWSIQTGVIKSLKYYQASPSQYKWPEAWGEAPAELNQIDARCSMIDIPLNVRYDFTTSRNRWFAQAGVTSYLMLKENYDYIFASNYNDQVWKSWEGKTGFYPAGVINLSGGVEKRIFRKMAVQIEPFFKVPIGKVGYGKVKLATAGLFVSTKLPLSK